MRSSATPPAAGELSTVDPSAGARGRLGPWHRTVVPSPVLVVGAIGAVQIGAALAKSLFGQAGPTGAVFLRVAFAAVILIGLTRPARAAWIGRGPLAAHRLVLAGYAACLLAMNWSFYEALARLPLGVAVTLEFIGPLSVAIAGSRRPRDLAWAGLAGTGVVLLTGHGGGRVTVVGALLALLAGALWAAYILLGARLGAAPGLSALAVALAAGALVVAPFGILAAGSRLLDPLTLLGGLGVALLSSAVPYSLELIALRRIPTAVFGVLMSLEPAAAALAGLALLGETLGWWEIVAIALVTIASAGATLSHRP